jgi:hypothetical protein
LTHTDATTEGTDDQHEKNGKLLTSDDQHDSSNGIEDGHEELNGSTSATKHSTTRPLSPYANV